MIRPRMDRGVRLTLLGMFTNALLAAVKTVAGLVGHSQALVADGVESFADLLSSLIVWRGLVVAAAPADEDHPYGHGKAEPLAGATVATLLLLAALGIVVSAGRDLLRDHEPPAPFTLAVLLGVVAIKELLFRRVLREGARLGSTALKSDAWHHRSDAITSLATGLGITVALVGGPAYAAADDLAALVAAAIIARNGSRLLRGALDELMDAAPDADLHRALADLAGGVPGVVRIEKCRLRRMGRHLYADMHVEVDPAMSVAAAHALAHQVKDRVRAGRPAVADVLVHVEPAGGPPKG